MTEKTELVTKTMRYEIAYNKQLYNLLYIIQYEAYTVKNKAISMAYDWQMYSSSYNERYGHYPNIKDFTGYNWQISDINKHLKVNAQTLYSLTREAAIKEAVDKFNNEKSSILKGEVSIPRYRRNGSFPIRKQQISELTKITSKKYTCKLALLSIEASKQHKLPSTKLDVKLLTGDGAYQILDRVIAKEYTLSDSRIIKKGKKFYLIISYQMEQLKSKLDPNKIMGIDIGLSTPAVLAINEDTNYSNYIGDGSEISNYQSRIADRRRRLQSNLKVSGQGNSGHGRKKKLQPQNKIGQKIHNFKETKNHAWARYIINEAVKKGCGTIQMEDLSGITKNKLFLKNWAFSSLQEKIINKAKEYGIQIVKIRPNYTSQRCSDCGHIDKDNRKTQEKFKCKMCNYELNADLNAARNISIKDIDEIISEYLEHERLKQSPATNRWIWIQI